MEVLVRLSIDKFFKNGLVESTSEAVILAFENHFLPYFETFDCHVWRKEKLWREEMDLVYSRFIDRLKTIYKKYTGKYMQPGSNKVFMSLEEF